MLKIGDRVKLLPSVLEAGVHSAYHGKVGIVRKISSTFIVVSIPFITNNINSISITLDLYLQSYMLKPVYINKQLHFMFK
jgi:ribosomal protein L21E